MNLVWARPTDNGSTINHFSVQYRLSGGSWTSAADAPVVSLSASISGLTAGSTYEFRVAAVNGIGTGTYSATASAVAPTPPVIYVADTFTRADSSSLGTTETGALTWAAINPSLWSIVSNTLNRIAGTITTNPNDVAVDTGQANGTITVTNLGTTANKGIVFRLPSGTNNTGYVFYNAGGTWTLSKRTGSNAYTALGTAAGVTPAAGDVMSVVLNGSSIVCKINGTVVITLTDTSYTGTRHGVWSTGTVAGQFDNWSHSDQIV
ncbi:fibronectin type III domain-containing protein [Arthrobacter sp. CDRTa11]|uniref:fibronectin type III domain-containing protein n=1 Tax=Arthrobacter sp. CDRTa11 TaxID=2651199 RepID=UPI002265E0BF|nr:fibronectin type III domain-containing protein [Arthrobacter sp. CDRTa11]UZX04328.1 fibronectin type III domain-containing protein [Arthrobacter sp. CDRTa11]